MKFYYVTEQEGYAEALFVDDSAKKRKCEKCGSIYESERVGKYKVKFFGKKQGDFYHAPGCYIASSKLIDLLKKYDIRGYSINEIESVGWYDKRGRALDIEASNLKEIYAEGRCGRMCTLKGEEYKGCELCGILSFSDEEKVNGISFDLATWDNTDIFEFSNWLGVMICSEKFKEACEKEKIKGIEFWPINDFSFM